MKTETVAELLVTYGCHLLLALPDDGSEYMNVMESFDDFTPPTLEPISIHLSYIDSILQKIQGKAVLYMDIHILREGFLLNTR
ncbi:MAG: hypothetical protein EXR62_14770 [Chloroflexi bacterium]|nr:hypothetical protein [Chloroflexota bacterium]